MHKSFATMIVGAMLAAAQTQTQPQPTTAELLQKGIYAQETAGDLDGAIKIYHQIVDSHPPQREIAAQAQYRLGLTLLAKGDANGASQEIQRLGWDFPDYKDLIASAKSAGGVMQMPLRFYKNDGSEIGQIQLFAMDRNLKEARDRATAYEDTAKAMAFESEHDAAFDFTKTTAVTGAIAQVQLMEPRAWITVNPSDGTSPVRVSLESINARVRAGGIGKTLNVGDQVVITGAPARDGTSIIQATRISDNGTQVYLRGNTPAK
jgi:tetratricopeptide (TPR) repeat protein